MVANFVGRCLLLGRFEPRRILAAGGQGLTAEAEDAARDGAPCVLKLAPATPLQAPALSREFQHLRRLHHPNIVRALDLGLITGPALVPADPRPVDVAGWSCLALERAPGVPLAGFTLAPDPRERTAQLWRLAVQLADALAYLHQQQVVHGDLSPANVAVARDLGVMLLDFGLAWNAAGRQAGGGQGTLGFAAPEALGGRITPRSDLFGFGATLYWAWCGQPPFGPGATGVAHMLAGHRPKPPSALRPGLPAPFEALLAKTLAVAPAERPPGALEVRRALERVGAGLGLSTGPGAPDVLQGALAPEGPAGDPLAGVFVGRGRELSTLDEALRALQDGRCSFTAIVLHGLPGSGRRTLLREAVARARLRAVAEGRPVAVLAAEALFGRSAGAGPVQASGDPAREVTARLARGLETAEELARQAPLLVVADDAAEAPVAGLLERIVAQPPGRCVFVWAQQEPPVADERVLAIAVGALARSDLVALLEAVGLPTDEAQTERLWQGSGGNPARLGLRVRQARLSPPVNEGPEPGVLEAFRQDLSSLSVPAQAAVLAAWCGVPPAAEGAAQAAARGWLSYGQDAAAGAGPEVPPGLPREALWGALAAPAEGAIRKVVNEALAVLPPDDPRRAELFRLAGNPASAFAACLDAAATAWRKGRAAGAEEAWQRAEAHAHGGGWPEAHVVWRAQALGLTGRYRQALAWLEAQPAPASVPSARDRALVRSWLLRRQGDLAGAASALAGAEATLSAEAQAGATEAVADLRARRARLLVAQGRFAEALALAGAVEATSPETQQVVWEVQSLAAAYLGRWEDAERAQRALAALDDPQAPEGAGRTAAVAGLLAQLQQSPEPAADAYRKALALYEAAGDAHGAANARLNLAMVLAEQGRLGESLAGFQAAYRSLVRLGAFADATAAAFNAGLLFVRLGDEAAAAAAEAQVRRAAERLGTRASAAWTETLAAERAWHRGAFAAAAAHHEQAAQLFADSGDPLRTTLARLGQVESWCLAGALPQARAAWLALGAEPPHLAVAFAWAGARLALAGDASVNVHTLAARLTEAADADRGRGKRVSAFRSAVLAARLWQRVSVPARAAPLIALARHLQQEIRMNTPNEHHESLAQDPDAAWLAQLAPGGGAADPRAWLDLSEKLSSSQARLRRFVRLCKRLNGELRLPRLLETVLDTVIELTEADRGFLLLREGDGGLAVRAARNIEQKSLEGEALAFSRSIAEQVARTGTPVITVDAAADDRFARALSVSDLQLRSVVAVPLTVKGQVEGTIYVDNRLRQGAFTDEDVAVLLDFSELAALAIGNARLISELRRRDRQIESLNQRLQSELSARKDEISSMRVQLSESRETFALRFDYRNIVGRSPRMMDLLRVLDRVSETHLPVVIQGESGTGKELVARALVANGPRKDKPFITENCAAIPETLLESTLFGYVRGAFTGADRDTRGLFSVAHEGTLFLDEVGEMSPGLQGKLLRVLQEGEFRRVGGQRPERTDVRLIVATNRDLEEMVRKGQFRQDLFFRLAVVRVNIPPLRERLEDLPLLVRHFLEVWQARAQVKARSITPEALACLSSYPWPGNVRELENEIGRAAVFAAETIGVQDLSPHIAHLRTDVASAPLEDGGTLKGRVEALEKALLREALARFEGNQTRAAESLGLSRFGLQKKLRRYALV